VQLLHHGKLHVPGRRVGWGNPANPSLQDAGSSSCHSLAEVNAAVVGEAVDNPFDFILCGLDAEAGHPIAACLLGGIKRGIGFRQQFLQFA
jgi:hypothetical protein